jgi:hypothetical protein
MVRARFLGPVVIVILGIFLGCGSKGPTSPSNPGGGASNPTPPATPPPVVPTIGYLAGRVTENGPGSPISNAKVEVIGGSSVGKWTLTTPSGEYTLANLTLGNNTIRVSKDGYLSRDLGLVLSNEANTQHVALLTVNPWSQTGTGNQVFNLPSYVTRVRIQATYTRFSSNFIIDVNGRLLVNELLGTGWSQTTYDGTHVVAAGGLVEITNSSGVTWTFTHVR